MRVARGGELAHTRESGCEGACTGGVGMGVGVGCDDDTAVDIIEVGPQRRRFGRSQSDFDASAAASPTLCVWLLVLSIALACVRR